ncbi:insulysin [Strigomonas culicis]|uniref:Insulysin n=3 Tax=Strigomonas culicis TaxID=28005 RepID=S9TW63_9TRYP|nr:insulysin [Strigomonas culicis]|eukprot:EPY20843.1 insulysin [Strigomonas culicis]
MPVMSFPIITPKILRQKCFAYKLPNGVKCIIVQDPNAKIPAAAMSIHAGQLSDPVDVPGLAHFCEHMLFMGTDKYPKEEEYSTYISKNGGSDNAWTDNSDTTFYFKVSDDAFHGALERFVEFFVAPLFAAGSVERELNAVHSEDEKSHNSDFWRIDELFRSLYNPKHPRSRYSNGNITTLLEEPSAKGIDTRDALKQYFAEHYLSEAACIVVMSTHSPEDILAVIEAPLLRMKSGPDNKFHFLSEDESLISPQHMGSWINIRTVKKLQSVHLHWVVRSAASLWKCRPASYISHVLGHECDSSVLGLLKQRNLATEMVVGPRTVDEDHHIFGVGVTLTTQGVEQVVEVIELVYAGIGLAIASGVDKRVYEQMKAEDRLVFESSEIGDSTTFCSSLATGANLYGLEHSWIGDECTLEDDLDAIVAYTKQLRPENCVITFRWGDMPLDASLADEAECPEEEEEEDTAENSDGAVEESEEEHTSRAPSAAAKKLFSSLPEFARVPANRRTRFHKAAYSQAPIPEEVQRQWTNALVGPYDPDLALPSSNPFITTDFTVYSPTTPNESWSTFPVEKATSPSGVVWVRGDAGHHLTFKSSICMTFLSPIAYKTPSNRVYLRIMKSILEDNLTELSYFGVLASLENAIDMPASGLSFSVNGPYQNLLSFFVSLVQKSLEISTLLSSEEKFTVYAETSQRALASVASKQPYEMARDRFAKLTTPLHYSYDDLLRPASEVTYDGYKQFVREYTEAGALFEGFMAGNVPDASTMPTRVAKLVEEMLPTHPAPSKESIPRFRDCYSLDGREGLNVIAFPPFNEADPNVCTLLSIYAGVETPHLRALCDCATKLFSSAFFDEMRTKEALGYVAFSATTRQGKNAHIQFVIQSALEDVDGLYLLSRIIAFLDAVEEQIDMVCNEADVQQIVSGLIAARERPPSSVRQDVVQLQADYLHPCGAHHRAEEVRCLKSISCADVKQFMQECLLHQREKTTAIAIIVNNARTVQKELFFKTESKTVHLPPQRVTRESKEAAAQQNAERLVLPSFADGERSVHIHSWSSIKEFQANLPILKDATL